ncbi:hypothetical protein DERP_005605 [Dermatophagoides pteronyssinus]|uniref:Uncharacterized protein n=1 Tax=Dermatophagoides pteronyssinus TaxID=6956 RepID=A0ABQ8J932_DERPT|nr:hypothetical protein DERP_005605 [Dermatophagoides pteronyssinus]
MELISIFAIIIHNYQLKLVLIIVIKAIQLLWEKIVTLSKKFELVQHSQVTTAVYRFTQQIKSYGLVGFIPLSGRNPRALILARNEASRSGTGARFSALYEYCMSDATIFVPIIDLKTSYLDAIIARCFVVRWDINID